MKSPNKQGDFHESANFPDYNGRDGHVRGHDCRPAGCGSELIRCRQARLQRPLASPTLRPPRLPWGDPDLQGTWTSDDTWGVPFERPKTFGTRATLTEDELKDREEER